MFTQEKKGEAMTTSFFNKITPKSINKRKTMRGLLMASVLGVMALPLAAQTWKPIGSGGGGGGGASTGFGGGGGAGYFGGGGGTRAISGGDAPNSTTSTGTGLGGSDSSGGQGGQPGRVSLSYMATSCYL